MALSKIWFFFESSEEAAAFITSFIYIFFIATQVTLGFYCMILMKKKGYGLSLAWFLLGAMLTFIGLLICLSKPKMQYQSAPFQQFGQYYNQPPMLQPYEAVHCSQCSADNPTGSNYCHECGVFLDRSKL